MKHVPITGMAEGGAENQDNPFSYKSFIFPTKDGESNIDSNSSSDILEKAKKSIPAEKQGSSSRNPYSFKHFLKSSNSENFHPSNNATYDCPIRCKAPGTRGKQVYKNDTVLSGSCSATSAILPDFIQDHIYNSNVNHLKSDIFSPEDFQNILPCDRIDNVKPVLNEIEAKDDVLTNLPDFISDGILNAEKDKSSEVPFNDVEDEHPSLGLVIDSSLPSTGSSDNSEHLRQLQEENASLVSQLMKFQTELNKKDTRILHLEKQIKKLQKKEAEDTVALETMVQQVEVNLQTTTERAVAAETNLTKAKEEIKLLQSHVKKLQKENEKLKEGSVRYCDVTAQAVSLGAQIQSAATSAEASLKSLLKGVEHVQLLSSLVSDIGKIQEEKS